MTTRNKFSPELRERSARIMARVGRANIRKYAMNYGARSTAGRNASSQASIALHNQSRDIGDGCPCTESLKSRGQFRFLPSYPSTIAKGQTTRLGV